MKFSFVLFSLLLIGIIFLSGCTSDSNQQEVQDQTDGSNEDGSSLKDIVSNKIKYSADYSITSAGKTQIITEVFDLPKFVMITETAQGSTRSIFDGSEYVVCSENLGSWTCYKMNVQESTQTEDVSKQVNDGAVINNIGTCSRAGETGTKYEITYNQVASKVCYTNDGIMLETESEGMTMYATKVSRSIDSSLFIPPATPQDLSSMIPGGLPNS